MEWFTHAYSPLYLQNLHLRSKEMANQTGLSESLFIGSKSMIDLELLQALFFLFLLIHLVASKCNTLAILNQILRISIYFIMKNSFFLDFGLLTTTDHKNNFTTPTKNICISMVICAFWDLRLQKILMPILLIFPNTCNVNSY